MDTQAMLFEIVKIILPSLVVLAAVHLIIKRFFDNESKARLLELKKATQSTVLPLRFQAYERICIFLERISPNSLIMRTHQSGISARELQSALLTTVRSEFDHNLSQQVYMTSVAWDHVKSAKEEVIKVINIAMSTLPDNASGMQLSKNIFEIVAKYEVVPTQRAIDAIKMEIRQII